MPYRPAAKHRKLKSVIFPLTAAVARVYGIRSDEAYPIGAFYTNLVSSLWTPVGNDKKPIWYVPVDAQKIADRNIDQATIDQFCAAIVHGPQAIEASDTSLSWEVIPSEEAEKLPPVRWLG